MKIILGLLALACVSSAFAEKARFDNYRVYTISIQSEKQLQTIQALENNPDGVKDFIQIKINSNFFKKQLFSKVFILE